MITDILICLLAAILGGFFMRLRGMDLGISTTFNRVMIAVVFGLTGLACGLPWPYAVAVILTSFAAAILGWGHINECTATFITSLWIISSW